MVTLGKCLFAFSARRSLSGRGSCSVLPKKAHPPKKRISCMRITITGQYTRGPKEEYEEADWRAHVFIHGFEFLLSTRSRQVRGRIPRALRLGEVGPPWGGRNCSGCELDMVQGESARGSLVTNPLYSYRKNSNGSLIRVLAMRALNLVEGRSDPHRDQVFFFPENPRSPL
ncbi:hypothetical protein BD779DRAFT_930369 [Infundibulicybe gibba]|nr:hypothetical protein BD779DRAFT_930369 [Infundibulicybe gibba]